MNHFAAIESVQASPYRLPTSEPESDGTLSWNSTDIVVVHVHAGGRTGMGYSYAPALAAAALVRDILAPAIEGGNAYELPVLWAHMNRVMRNAGRPGLGMMAVSAVDIALWDLKAKLLDIPLAVLWGSIRPAVVVYGSGGFTSYSEHELESQLHDWVSEGFKGVKIKIGDGPDQDAHRVAIARAAVGETVELMADANGAYSPRDAMRLMDVLQQCRVGWLEEPVSSDNLAGLRWVRDRTPAGIAVAAGEYGWDGIYYRRMLEAGAVDVLQVDATRCGYTGFLHAASLCEAYEVPMSAHCAPALHVSVGACARWLRHIEYFHDHVRLESILLEGVPELSDGQLLVNTEQPGHGLSLHASSAASYRL